MSLLQAMRISSSGLFAERQRIDQTVSNLANARTTRTDSGGPYRRRDVVFEASPVGASFEEELARSMEPMGVRVAGVVVDTRPPQRVHDPGHPDADEEGYVDLPNVNAVEELVNLVAASRSFEANLTAVDVTRRLVERSIDLGRA